MRAFEAKLSKARLTPAEASNRVFDSTFFRPLSGPLRQRWEDLRAERLEQANAPESPAQVLLLSYRPDFGGSLWLLEARTSGPSHADFSAQARRVLERATLLVSRELPALVELPHGPEAWSLLRIATGGETVLDGESFGLSMCLFAAARCLGLPSPTNIAATAAIDSEGALLEVRGLRQKLSILYQWALGIDTVLVPADQAEDARQIARELGSPWQITGVRSLSEAMTHAFPNLWSEIESRWSSLSTLEQVASHLLRLARDGSNHVLSWKGIGQAAARAIAKLPADSAALKNARFAELVAQRHEGAEALLPLDTEHLNGMRRPLRSRCLAHIVQSHADSAEMFDPVVEDTVRNAVPRDAHDDCPHDLWLLGAQGRFLAAFFRYDEAETALLRAVQGWFELDSIPDASHALSELLRVVAVKRDLTAFLRVVGSYAEPFLRDPSVAAVSRGFVLYSLGRGHALLDQPSKAHWRLSSDACDWNLLPDHLRALRLRWVIRASRAEGLAVTDQYRAQLSGVLERAPTLAFIGALAELDRAQQEQSDPGPALHAFAEHRPLECRRFSIAYPGDVVTHLVREYRY